MGSAQIYVSNFSSGTKAKDLESLFDRAYKVERVDMKSNFAFVVLANPEEVKDAVRHFDGQEFGEEKKNLRVEVAKGNEKKESNASNKPNETLFVVNFDTEKTGSEELRKEFGKFGELVRVELKRNFAFIEFKNLNDAIKACETWSDQLWDNRKLTVEYTARNLGRRKSPPPRGGSPRRRSPGRRTPPGMRRTPPRGRSPPPYRGRSPPRRSPPRGARSPPRAYYDRRDEELRMLRDRDPYPRDWRDRDYDRYRDDRYRDERYRDERYRDERYRDPYPPRDPYRRSPPPRRRSRSPPPYRR